MKNRDRDEIGSQKVDAQVRERRASLLYLFDGLFCSSC